MTTPHDLVRAYQARAKKRFGQHFLSDPSILGNICDVAEVEEGDHVLEIGPGPGTLTHTLLERGAVVHAIEIDRDAVAFLTEEFGDHERFTLIESDVLKVHLGEVLDAAPSATWKCVANLPYNISTPILFELAKLRDRLDVLALMFQREVAERMIATPEQSNDFSVLSLMTALHFDAEIAMTLPPGAFYPPPKVHSAVVALRPVHGSRIPDGEVRQRFERIVKAGFQQRRKTLPNGLKSLGIDKDDARDAMRAVGLDPRARPETIDFETFAQLSERLEDA